MENRLGASLYVLRKMKGVTQTEVGQAMNVSVTAVSKWERGLSLPDIYVCCDLADYFGVTLDELLGRNGRSIGEVLNLNQDTLTAYGIGRDLLRCCQISRKEGLLAMEELVAKESSNPFLAFSVQYLMKHLRQGHDLQKAFLLLRNYARSEGDRAEMIVEVLEQIVSGENEYWVKELIASHLGFRCWNKLFMGTERQIEQITRIREEILEGYSGKTAMSNLLEELSGLSSQDIQTLIRNVDNVTLVHALKGASGEICKVFLSNLSDRLFYFIHEDIGEYEGYEEEIVAAQKKVLELVVGLKLIELQ